MDPSEIVYDLWSQQDGENLNKHFGMSNLIEESYSNVNAAVKALLLTGKEVLVLPNMNKPRSTKNKLTFEIYVVD